MRVNTAYNFRLAEPLGVVYWHVVKKAGAHLKKKNRRDHKLMESLLKRGLERGVRES